MTYRNNQTADRNAVIAFVVLLLLVVALFIGIGASIANSVKHETLCSVAGGEMIDHRCFDPADEIDLDKVGK